MAFGLSNQCLETLALNMGSVSVSFYFTIWLAFCKSTTVVPSGINLRNVTTTISSNGSNVGTQSLKKYLVMKSGAAVDVQLSNFEMAEGSFLEYEGKTQSQPIHNCTIVMKHRSFFKQSIFSPANNICFDGSSFDEGKYPVTLKEFDGHTVFEDPQTNLSNTSLFNSVLHMDSARVEFGGKSLLSLRNSTFSMKNSSIQGKTAWTKLDNSHLSLNDATITLGNWSFFQILYNSTFAASQSDVCTGPNRADINVMFNSSINLTLSTIKLAERSTVSVSSMSTLQMVESKLDLNTSLVVTGSVVTMKNSSLVSKGNGINMGPLLSELSLTHSKVEMMRSTMIGFVGNGAKLIATNLHLKMEFNSTLFIMNQLITAGGSKLNFHLGSGSSVYINDCRITGDVDIPPGIQVINGYGNNFVCRNPIG